MAVEIKICGIRDPASLEAASAAGADWIGLVFFPPSPRFLKPSEAAALIAGKTGPARAGLFVDPSDADVAEVLRQVRLDALQVYASAQRVADLKARFGVPVWRAVGVLRSDDLPEQAGAADRLVIEAKPPPDSDRPGGNAARFDWSVLRGWRAPVPWFLAGGLHAGNVAAAISETDATGVDVSSGVERAPGVKDAALIGAFVAAARSARPPDGNPA